MKKCHHPNIVCLLEVLDDSSSKTNKIYLVLEYLEKGELHWQDAKGNPILSMEQARDVARDVISGLEYLHFQGIIHRDIKPANLLRDQNGTVKISDFGVSYATSLNNGTNDELELAKTAGTPAFFAPELCAPIPADGGPRPPITKKIDIWAFGVTLFCLIYGKLPFSAESEFELFQVIANEPLVFPDEVSEFPVPKKNKNFHSIFYNQPTGDNCEKQSTLEEEEAKDEATHAPSITVTPDPKLKEVKDLLRKLLEKDPVKRIDMEDIKHHPWIMDGMDQPLLEHFLTNTASEQKIDVTTEEVQEAVSGIGSRIKRGLSRFRSHIAKGLTRKSSSSSSSVNQSSENSRSNSRDAPSSIARRNIKYFDKTVFSNGHESDFSNSSSRVPSSISHTSKNHNDSSIMESTLSLNKSACSSYSSLSSMSSSVNFSASPQTNFHSHRDFSHTQDSMRSSSRNFYPNAHTRRGSRTLSVSSMISNDNASRTNSPDTPIMHVIPMETNSSLDSERSAALSRESHIMSGMKLHQDNLRHISESMSRNTSLSSSYSRRSNSPPLANLDHRPLSLGKLTTSSNNLNLHGVLSNSSESSSSPTVGLDNKLHRDEFPNSNSNSEESTRYTFNVNTDLDDNGRAAYSGSNTPIASSNPSFNSSRGVFSNNISNTLHIYSDADRSSNVSTSADGDIPREFEERPSEQESATQLSSISTVKPSTLTSSTQNPPHSNNNVYNMAPSNSTNISTGSTRSFASTVSSSDDEGGLTLVVDREPHNSREGSSLDPRSDSNKRTISTVSRLVSTGSSGIKHPNPINRLGSSAASTSRYVSRIVPPQDTRGQPSLATSRRMSAYDDMEPIIKKHTFRESYTPSTTFSATNQRSNLEPLPKSPKSSFSQIASSSESSSDPAQSSRQTGSTAETSQTSIHEIVDVPSCIALDSLGSNYGGYYGNEEDYCFGQQSGSNNYHTKAHANSITSQASTQSSDDGLNLSFKPYPGYTRGRSHSVAVGQVQYNRQFMNSAVNDGLVETTPDDIINNDCDNNGQESDDSSSEDEMLYI